MTAKRGRINHLTFAEHWTDSGQVVVLDGRPETIREIARSLSLPGSRVVQVGSDRALLAIWESLPRARFTGYASGKNNSNRHTTFARAYHNPSSKCGDEMCDHRETKP